VRWAATLALAGCAPTLGMGRAEVLADRTERWDVALHGSVVSAHLADGLDAPLPWVQPQVGWHRGVGHGVELGARARTFGVPGWFTTLGGAVDAKFALSSAHAPVSVAVSASVDRPSLGGTPWTVGGLETRLLTGVPVGSDGEFTWSGRVGVGVMGAAGQRPIPAPGLGTGLALSVPAGRLRLVPEVALGWIAVDFDGAIRSVPRGATTLELALGIATR